MLTRSQIRHACYRAKNKAATAANQEILNQVEPLLIEGQTWDNFSDIWDIFVNKGGEIKIVHPERDAKFIEKTLLKISTYFEIGKSLDSLTERELNVYAQVNPLLLDGVMTWENYQTVWSANLDSSTNAIRTKLFNVKSTQIEVTPEMIEASKKDADGSVYTGEHEIKPVEVEMKPMSEKDKLAFSEFLAKKQNKDKQ